MPGALSFVTLHCSAIAMKRLAIRALGSVLLVLLYGSRSVTTAVEDMSKPNFILVMCDDMDLVLGGVSATPQVKRLLGSKGASGSNYFVSSPKCTPSRSAWYDRQSVAEQGNRW